MDKLMTAPAIQKIGEWEKITVTRDNGEQAEAQAPIIVSASRSTDIPTYYADWFFNRLEKGYCAWKNPFNGKNMYVSFKKTRFIVFWSKQPRPLIPYLDRLQTISKEGPIGCCLQYTLNDYAINGKESEGLERHLAPLAERIETFQELSERLGKDSIIWRFDPLLLTDRYSEDELLERMERIGEKVHKHTSRLVFSFADFYKKTLKNLKEAGIQADPSQWTRERMEGVAERIAALAKKWGISAATCGEEADLSRFGIAHSHFDEDLIIRLAHKDKILMDYLRVKIEPRPRRLNGEYEPLKEGQIDLGNGHIAQKHVPKPSPKSQSPFSTFYKDKGQRPACGCTAAKDIGEYDTCCHRCLYCYANTNHEKALAQYRRHREFPFAENITGSSGA